MSRRRSRRRFPLFRFVLVCVVLTVSALAVLRGVLFLKSDRGHAWALVQLGQERSPRAAGLLTRALRGALRIVGATERELAPDTGVDGAQCWRMELPPTVSLTQADYAL